MARNLEILFSYFHIFKFYPCKGANLITKKNWRFVANLFWSLMFHDKILLSPSAEAHSYTVRSVLGISLKMYDFVQAIDHKFSQD